MKESSKEELLFYWSILNFFYLPIIFLLLAMAAIFPYISGIEQSRDVMSPEIYAGIKDCDCSCISNSRPWYSTFNYWFWLWVLLIPRVILYIKPNPSKWKKIILPVIMIGLCYILMNLALHLMWDIRNNIFYGLDASLTGGELCTNIADSGSIVFYALFGWIPASLYISFWFLIRWIYRKKS